MKFFLVSLSLLVGMILAGCTTNPTVLTEMPDKTPTEVNTPDGKYYLHRKAVRIPATGNVYAELWKRFGEDSYYVRNAGSGNSFSLYPRSLVASDEEIREQLKNSDTNPSDSKTK